MANQTALYRFADFHFSLLKINLDAERSENKQFLVNMQALSTFFSQETAYREGRLQEHIHLCLTMIEFVCPLSSGQLTIHVCSKTGSYTFSI